MPEATKRDDMDFHEESIHSQEIERLTQFCKNFIHRKLPRSVIVYGNQGNGIKKIILAALDNLLRDRELANLSLRFGENDIIRTSYSEEDRKNPEPYKAFIEFARVFEKRRRILFFLGKIVMIFVDFFGYGFVQRISNLAKDVKAELAKEAKPKDIRDKERKVFARFTKEIGRLSHKKPFILVVDNAQYMDEPSLHLLKYLSEMSALFWGGIILNYTQDAGTSPADDSILWIPIKEGYIQTIKAKPFDMGNFSEYQQARFHRILFSREESQGILERAHGVYSEIAKTLDHWVGANLISQRNGTWEKSDLLDNLHFKTETEKLVDEFREYLKTGLPDEKQELGFVERAKGLNYSDGQIEELRPLARFEISNDRYHIISKVREGAIGDIYKALDRERNALVFIEIERRIPEQPSCLDLKSIRNDVLLNTIEIREADKFNFVVTEYTPEKTLADLIPEYKFFDCEKTLSLSKGLLAAVSYLHLNNIVHGNLRPENFFIEDNGRVRIAGIGLAQSLQYDVAKRLSRIKTSPYSSPEHLSGEGLNTSSDVFSMGIILYELWVGTLPFQGRTKEQLMSEPVKDSMFLNLDSRKELKSILLTTLAKNQNNRYSKADELRKEFLKVTCPAPVNIAPPPASSAAKWLKRALAAAGVLALAFFVGKPVIEKTFAPKYMDEIFINKFAYSGAGQIPDGSMEYLIKKALLSATNLPVLQENMGNAAGGKFHPVLSISGKVEQPKINNYVISLEVKNRNKTAKKEFLCLGTSGILKDSIKDILAFLSENSGKLVGSGGRPLGQWLTEDWMAFDSFFEGEKQWALLDSDKSKVAFHKALNLNPAFSLAHLRLAEIYIWSSSPDLATRELESIRNPEKELSDLDLIFYNVIKARLAKDSNAERQYLENIERVSQDATACYNLAEFWFSRADTDNAIPEYRDAIDKDPNFSKAYNHLGLCYAWIGKHDEAEQNLTQYVQLDHTSNAYDSLAAGYMFAGRYDKAVSTCREGLKKEDLYSLYGNMAQSLILQGKLKEAEECLSKEDKLLKTMDLQDFEIKSSKIDIQFERAYIDYLRKNYDGSKAKLKPVEEFYSASQFQDDLGDTANLAFWLEGLMAYDRGSLPQLQSSLAFLEKKMKKFSRELELSYYPIVKLDLHLRVLEGALTNNLKELQENIDKGREIKNKLGYWTSKFNLNYFFDEFAAVLISKNRQGDAGDLLTEALAYNPNDAMAYLQRAILEKATNKKEEARESLKKAKDLMAGADRDYRWLIKLNATEKEQRVP